jgi:hypothetical protein
MNSMKPPMRPAKRAAALRSRNDLLAAAFVGTALFAEDQVRLIARTEMQTTYLNEASLLVAG